MKQCLLILLLLPTISIAQRNFQDGYVITLKGDTIHGKIDFQEWSFSPKSVVFKPANNTGTQKFDVGSIQYFEVAGKEAYKRFVARVSLSPEKLGDLQTRDTTSRQDTVFMQIIHSGVPLSLLYYADAIKERFYLLEQGKEQPYELIKREYYANAGSTSVTTENLYRQQLIAALFAGKEMNMDIASRINLLPYEQKEIKKLILYADEPTAPAQQSDMTEQKQIRFFVGGGIQQTKIGFEGQQFFATKPASQSASFLPALSAGIDFIPKPAVGKLLFRLKAGYRSAKSVTTGSSGNNTVSVYELSMTTFSLQPHIIFNLYNKPNFKLPVGLAFGYAVNSYSKNRLTDTYPSNPSAAAVIKENYFKLQKGNISPQAHVGVVLKNKLEVSAIYQLPVDMTNYSVFGVYSSVMQLEVLYLFGKR